MSLSGTIQNSLFYNRPTFTLSRIDIFNWGSFEGFHSAEINPHGTAIIGPTGSGKTTIIDAFMTLLSANPKYNLASTGGHESDRNLMSYIRGVSGAGNATDDSHVLRTGKTTTGIGARFSNGNEVIQICAIFWINGPSNSASDRNDIWIISEDDDRSLKDWLDMHQRGGTRTLKQCEQEISHLRLSNTKKRYLADLRRFFEVGENAFTLLNRTAGLKQINSVNEVFREFVLDDHSAFNRAEEVIREFDNLADIYEELELARRQQESLVPVEKCFYQYQDVETKLTKQKELQKVVPLWFALSGKKLWGEKIEEFKLDYEDLELGIEKLSIDKEALQAEADTLMEAYLQAGGNTIEQLKKLIEIQKERAQERKRNASDYQKVMTQLGINSELSVAEFERNKQWAMEQSEELNEQRDRKKAEAFEYEAKRGHHQMEVNNIKDEIVKIESRPESNLPANFQDFRSELAQELNMNDDDLPFVAELVQVKPEESKWRGAIERAIGSHRLRIIIPGESLEDALRWVNNRDNRLHVRLLEAKKNKKQIEFFKDGFTRKLNFKKHLLREPLKELLGKIDRHCVARPEELRKTPHGMTSQGLMSGHTGMYEKQDQRPLNRDWMTGFDNRDRLISLREDLRSAKLKLDEFQKKYQDSFDQLRGMEQKLDFIKTLIELNFDKIDLPQAEREVKNSTDRLNELIAPDSSATENRNKYERACKKLNDIGERIISLRTKSGVLKSKYEEALKKQREAKQRVGKGLTDEELALAKEHLPLLKIGQIVEIDNIERKTKEKVDQFFLKLDTRFHQYEKELVRLMNIAKNTDTGTFNEVGTEIQDIPTYLERLKVLNEEALPKKQKRFLSYLNQSSDQGVVQLLTDIENEVSIIEERIDGLNKTLKRVDYEPGRHIQLVPQRIKHHTLSELEGKQRRLRSAMLKDEEGESHFRALESIIKIFREATGSKRTIAARALLDPRSRLSFIITILDNKTSEVIERRSGSQSGSGGEKEVIASYILVASLSYALCPQGAIYPLFNTIMLDEAFSKTSQKRASRIISAISEFGLHPLFLTPNKEMRLLRNHTRAAILVHRKDTRASLATLTWKELEEYAKKKLEKVSEVT